MGAKCSATPWPRAWATTCWASPGRCSASATSSSGEGTPRAGRRQSQVRSRADEASVHRAAHGSSAAVELDQRNANEVLHGIDRTMSLDEDTLRSIDRSVHDEVARRMRLLDEQRDRALQQLNEARRTSRETPLHEIPDESYNAAFHQLFDHPELTQVPAEDELLTLLKRSTGNAGAVGPAALTRQTDRTARRRRHRRSTRTCRRAARRRRDADPRPGPRPHRTWCNGDGRLGTNPSKQWRTNATMGGRFQALGNALLGDFANDQIENFGSVFGFDQQFEQGIHDDIDASTTVLGATGATGDSAAVDAAHQTAARSCRSCGRGPPGRRKRPSTRSSAIRTRSTSWPPACTPTFAADCARSC